MVVEMKVEMKVERKVERKESKKFVPVVITLETREEFFYLLGLTNLSREQKKRDMPGYNGEVDWKLWSQLNKFKDK